MSAPGAAWRFLTRVPLGDAAHDGAAMHRAPAWFPAIGAIVGVLVAAVYAGVHRLTGPTTAAAVAIAAGALVTGGFHHDGLADVADAYGGGWDVEQRLAILKDSRHGTYGVLALVCVLVVQVSALAEHDPRQAFAVLVAGHATARAGAVVLLRVAPRAPAEGLGTSYARGLRTGTVLVAVAATCAIDVALLGALAGWVLLAAAIGALAVGLLAIRKVGGVNGDALGAAEQVAETLVLVCGAALVRHAGTWPWWR